MYLKTDDPEYSYSVTFHNGDFRNGVVRYHVEKLLKRKDVIELMSKEIETSFQKAMDSMGYGDMSIEDFIVSKRLSLIEKVLNSKNDKHLYLADKALTGLETLSGLLNKGKSTYTQQETIRISLSDADKAGLLQTPQEEKVEEAEVVAG